MDLHAWGWDPALQQAFDALGASDLAPARVARHDRTGHLLVRDGDDVFARLPRHLRDDPPVVGDWVAYSEPATIRALLPRRTKLARSAPGGGAREQVIAANVDVLLVVAAADDINLARLDRYRVLAASSGVRCVLVVSKADLARPAPPPGFEDVVATSAATGDGVDALRALVPPGVTAALVGPSGVGKTSLVNALLGREALPTAPVRASDGRGRHTTTARHLLALPGGGVLLDTPGMRELGMWGATTAVAAAFEDVEALALRCRFRDCAHATEPGCAVRDALPPERLASWRKLLREAEAAARRADVAKLRADGRAWGKMARRQVRAKEERRG